MSSPNYLDDDSHHSCASYEIDSVNYNQCEDSSSNESPLTPPKFQNYQEGPGVYPAQQSTVFNNLQGMVKSYGKTAHIYRNYEQEIPDKLRNDNEIQTELLDGRNIRGIIANDFLGVVHTDQSEDFQEETLSYEVSSVVSKAKSRDEDGIKWIGTRLAPTAFANGVPEHIANPLAVLHRKYLRKSNTASKYDSRPSSRKALTRNSGSERSQRLAKKQIQSSQRYIRGHDSDVQSDNVSYDELNHDNSVRTLSENAQEFKVKNTGSTETQPNASDKSVSGALANGILEEELNVPTNQVSNMMLNSTAAGTSMALDEQILQAQNNGFRRFPDSKFKNSRRVARPQTDEVTQRGPKSPLDAEILSSQQTGTISNGNQFSLYNTPRGMPVGENSVEVISRSFESPQPVVNGNVYIPGYGNALLSEDHSLDPSLISSGVYQTDRTTVGSLAGSMQTPSENLNEISRSRSSGLSVSERSGARLSTNGSFAQNSTIQSLTSVQASVADHSDTQSKSHSIVGYPQQRLRPRKQYSDGVQHPDAMAPTNEAQKISKAVDYSSTFRNLRLRPASASFAGRSIEKRKVGSRYTMSLTSSIQRGMSSSQNIRLPKISRKATPEPVARKSLMRRSFLWKNLGGYMPDLEARMSMNLRPKSQRSTGRSSPRHRANTSYSSGETSMEGTMHSMENSRSSEDITSTGGHHAFQPHAGYLPQNANHWNRTNDMHEFPRR